VISVVIPAFNEESYLPTTLASLRDAIAVCCCGVELIVIDNESANRTSEIARSFGAIVVHEAVHNIARVRNAGASAARGDVLAFVDADTIIPPYFLEKVAAAWATLTAWVAAPTSSIRLHPDCCERTWERGIGWEVG